MKVRLLLLLSLLFASHAVAAALATVASTTSAEMLLREVGGEAVAITTLAPPDRDVHMLQVRPSMMRALRSARLVVAIGAELESGWLPLAISSAANPKILPGRDGYFEIAAQVPLLGAQAADRSKGDVHPMGNPHVQMDPLRMADAGLALAERLAKLEPAQAANFRARAQRFRQQVQARLPQWQQQLAGAPGALLYHRDGDYLMARFGVPILGYVEPLPGVPPTAAHLAGLVGRLRGSKGVVLHTVFQSNRGVATLASQLGWRAHALPLDPPSGASGAAYLDLVGKWVAALASAR
ncbi:MAG: zinc transporter substrate-binding protein [Moraxellaceae bacterium]|jgi:zinc/manganese transport system substrate-binding protein|nr:zinc transporter substrate-binding protein [Moraxellaceae bacterium]